MSDQNFSTVSGGAPVSKTKWIVQLVVSVLCGGNIITLILAILGLVKADTDLETANKYYKWAGSSSRSCGSSTSFCSSSPSRQVPSRRPTRHPPTDQRLLVITTG